MFLLRSRWSVGNEEGTRVDAPEWCHENVLEGCDGEVTVKKPDMMEEDIWTLEDGMFV
jgi:hypothetical protein